MAEYRATYPRIAHARIGHLIGHADRKGNVREISVPGPLREDVRAHGPDVTGQPAQFGQAHAPRTPARTTTIRAASPSDSGSPRDTSPRAGSTAESIEQFTAVATVVHGGP